MHSSCKRLCIFAHLHMQNPSSFRLLTIPNTHAPCIPTCISSQLHIQNPSSFRLLTSSPYLLNTHAPCIPPCIPHTNAHAFSLTFTLTTHSVPSTQTSSPYLLNTLTSTITSPPAAAVQRNHPTNPRKVKPTPLPNAANSTILSNFFKKAVFLRSRITMPTNRVSTRPHNSLGWNSAKYPLFFATKTRILVGRDRCECLVSNRESAQVVTELEKAARVSWSSRLVAGAWSGCTVGGVGELGEMLVV